MVCVVSPVVSFLACLAGTASARVRSGKSDAVLAGTLRGGTLRGGTVPAGTVLAGTVLAGTVLIGTVSAGTASGSTALIPDVTDAIRPSAVAAMDAMTTPSAVKKPAFVWVLTVQLAGEPPMVAVRSSTAG